MMEEANYPQAAYNAKSDMNAGSSRRLDLTLRQNIDERIKQAQAAVAELEATRDRMEKSGILDCRIDDIQRSMRF